MSTSTLLSLPVDILSMLPDYLANIEDYMNLSSTCQALRNCTKHVSPKTILRLAEVQSNVFFRPAPYFLVAATARELGDWARKTDENEAILRQRLEEGIDGLIELCLQHCGLTMERIRELHLLRFSIINPVTNIIDQCVGAQWHDVEDFWDGGRSDAYTIYAEPSLSFFHLAIYGELFSVDFEPILNQDSTTRRLSPDTRIEYIKYCVPDVGTQLGRDDWERDVRERGLDSRRAVKNTGPYENPGPGDPGSQNHNIALTWTIKSSRWRPHWKTAREAAAPDFVENLGDWWWTRSDDWSSDDADKRASDYWRQRLWENICICQGLEGLGIVRPEHRAAWVGKMREWRTKIAALEEEPAIVDVASQTTRVYPFLLGDLRICVSGYVPGTMRYPH